MAPDWARLAAPFPPSALTWRVLRLSEDRAHARLRPQLHPAAVTARLDTVVGPTGWSHQYLPIGERALICTLSLDHVSKSAVVSLGVTDDPATCAADALAYAAEHFGLRPPANPDAEIWVDADPDSGEPLYYPDPVLPPQAADPSIPNPSIPNPSIPNPSIPNPSIPGTSPSNTNTPNLVISGLDEPAAPPLEKSAGQQTIDRLMERLKAEGLGGEAARLVVANGGYGGSAEAARVLYAKLRALLKERTV